MQHTRNHAANSIVTFFFPILVVVHNSRLRNLTLQLFHEGTCPGGNGLNSSIAVVPFVVSILKVIPPKDHDCWKRIDTVLGTKLVCVIGSAVYFRHHQPGVCRVRLDKLRVGFLPNRLQFLTPVTPRSKEIDNHNLMLQARCLETCGIQQQGVVFTGLKGRIVRFMLHFAALLMRSKLPPGLVEVDFTNPSCKTSIVRPHKVCGIY
mmetsp:Transcript_16046/g.34120  ORF Transcript_16046/g.34120 Transcript_16046/m.34120 type:complete len:206 (+) Transcript_16046:991-1608(+)